MIKQIAILLFLAAVAGAQIQNDLPQGLMFNLDIEQANDGLIPSKTLYPLFVPQGDLGIETFNGRNILDFQFGQGLDIPHSSLLDPDASEWVVSIRVLPLTDGLIVSQANEQHGYAIYMKDGYIAATVRTRHSAFTLKEQANRNLTKYAKRWVTIELRIRANTAMLYLNRERVAMVRDQPALDGENLRIRLGNHNAVPSPRKNTPIPATGFTGAIGSLKITRQ